MRWGLVSFVPPNTKQNGIKGRTLMLNYMKAAMFRALRLYLLGSMT